MVADADGSDDRVRRLLQLGARLGYLTYQMLNDELPHEVVSPSKLDALLMEIDRRGIRLIDEDDAPPPPLARA